MTSTLTSATYLFGQNADYITKLYQQYLTAPGQVDASWQQFFGTLNGRCWLN
jgi:2-oxoglutarate dehydrogenase complex dehydrogenase (E1) component-like enzyme